MTVEGTPADRFAAEHAHYVEDLPFWRSLAAEAGGPVLDLGAAVGRVTLALARDGHRVCAVDADPAMLAELRRAAELDAVVAARVSTCCQDLRAMRLHEAFKLVLMPMNTLQAFLSRADQLAALTAARHALEAGGVFAFDVVMADLDVLGETVGQVHDGVVYDDVERGATLVHRARFDAVDRASRTVRFTLLIEERAGSAEPVRFERSHTVHLFEPSELWDLLAEAGFVVQAVYGDFDGSPLDAESERQIYRCEAA